MEVEVLQVRAAGWVANSKAGYLAKTYLKTKLNKPKPQNKTKNPS